MTERNEVMPKLKTRKGVAKRFRVTKKGKVKGAKASKRHLLTGKPRKRKRHLSAMAVLGKVQAKTIRTLLPYS